MNIQLFLFLIILPYCLTFVCSPDDQKCFCFPSHEYEFQCPSMDDMRVLIHAQQRSYARIDCVNVTSFDLQYLPDYPAGETVKDFEIRRCPLRSKDLALTLSHFNVSRVKYLKLEEIWMVDDFENQRITMNLFKGLEDLQTLDLRYMNTTIDRDFLEHLPNLERLYLEQNNIQTVDFRFNHSVKLVVLHLSQNAISEIPAGVFSDLVHLKQLHLWKNNLTTLTKASLAGLSQISSLELSKNSLEVLDDDVFSEMPELLNLSLLANKLSNLSVGLFRNNPKLEGLKLGFNRLRKVPDGIFANLSSLKELQLQHAWLEEIPVDPLSTLKNLRRLTLAWNNISEIPVGAFSALGKLESLDLRDNKISALAKSAFEGATGLKTILLRNNAIKTIEDYAFHSLGRLVELDLSHNRVALERQGALLCDGLEQLMLGYNLVDKFPDQLVLNNVHLRELDLSNNKISYINANDLLPSTTGLAINLCSNNITEIDFTDVEFLAKFKATNDILNPVTVTLASNNLSCDCSAYKLLLYINKQIKVDNLDLILDNVLCSSPEEWKGEHVTNLKPSQITCEKLEEDYCPGNCSCYHKFYKPNEDTYVVDCRSRQLTTCPVLRINGTQERIEVNLDGNLIESGPEANTGYERVNSLLMSHNLVRKFDWIPPNIEILNLDNNRLSLLPRNAVASLKKAVHLQRLVLTNNPWKCDCAAAELHNFLKTEYKKVNVSNILCADDNLPLFEKTELCVAPASLVLWIVLPIVIVFLVAVILVMRFKHYIVVWLFSKRLCMWLVSEKDLDKDKRYDVFVSYAHQDEEFVMTELLPMLEREPYEFRTCIHVRDWVPGDLITTQVERSVHDSRRTLVVLSDHFLDSCWGRLEFKTAHVKAIKDNCSRVIVLKYGALDEKKLDDDLRSYLKTNTYVEWGGPWFWKKLYYALPHKQTGRGYQESLKNVMLKIDDKFELSAEPITMPDSTPPVLGADASKLKRNALDFVPSESPLIKR